MRELAGRFVPRVAKTGGRGETVDRRLVSGEEMPARRRPGMIVTIVALERDPLSRRCLHWRFARVEAHGHDLEIRAGIDGHQVESTGGGAQHLRAEHRAIEVDQREHHGPGAEVVAQPHGAARFVSEADVERNALVQLLVESDFAQGPGQGGGRSACLAFVASGGRAAHLGAEGYDRHCQKHHHGGHGGHHGGHGSHRRRKPWPPCTDAP